MFGNVLVAISGELTKQRLTRKEFEKKALFSSTTYSQRLKHPGDFTLVELSRISNALNTTVQNLLSGRISGLEE
jgi:hypothetical protein